MSVSKKNKRKIVVSGRAYYWYVVDEPVNVYTTAANPDGHTVFIISDDKAFAVNYVIDSDFIAVTGKEFPGRPYKGRTWRLRCPVFTKDICTPKTIEEIIMWCFSENKELVSVDWQGKHIE